MKNKKITPCDRWDAEAWLGHHKDIWGHPMVSDRNNKRAYEVADLLAEFANWYYFGNNKSDDCSHTFKTK